MKYLKFNVESCKGIFYLEGEVICFKVDIQLTEQECLISDNIDLNFIKPNMFNHSYDDKGNLKSTNLTYDNIKAIKLMIENYKSSVIYTKDDILQSFAKFRLKIYNGPIEIDDSELVNHINHLEEYIKPFMEYKKTCTK